MTLGLSGLGAERFVEFGYGMGNIQMVFYGLMIKERILLYIFDWRYLQ